MQVEKKKKPIYQTGNVGWHEFDPNKIILNLNLQKKCQIWVVLMNSNKLCTLLELSKN